MEASVIFLLLGLGVVKGADWSYKDGYDGPKAWGNEYPWCNGNKQSPINIDTKIAQHDKDLVPFVFTGYDTSNLGMSLTNNGHSATVNINSGDAYVMAGGLPGQSFKVAQFHFHWGPDLWQGSEHQVNGRMYPAEMHIVHYNTKYGDLGAAVDKADGLAVLGVFIEAGDYANTAFNSIVQGLPNVVHKDELVNLSPLSLMSLLPMDVKTFYRYKGSLTTPACYESVTWTVFKDTVKLSPIQISAFRTLMENAHDSNHSTNGSYILENFRPVQPLNGRNLWVSNMPHEDPPVKEAGALIRGSMCLVFVILSLVLFKL